jgi:hypothetical protein
MIKDEKKLNLYPRCNTCSKIIGYAMITMEYYINRESRDRELEEVVMHCHDFHGTPEEERWID